jgi:hypothetical protein
VPQRRSDLIERRRLGLQYVGDALDVVELQNRERRLRQSSVTGDGDNAIIFGIKERLADRGPMHFKLGIRVALEPFDNNQIGRRELCKQVLQRRLGLAPQFVNERPAPARCHQNLARAGSAVQPGILARLIDIKFVVRMFHRGDFQAPTGKNWNNLGDQRRFAGSTPAGETDDAHAHGRYDRDARRLLRPSP